MHRAIGNDDEHPRNHAQSNDIAPQSLRVKPERTEDGCAWDFDVQAVFVVDQGEECHFVDNKSLKTVVEYGQLEKS